MGETVHTDSHQLRILPKSNEKEVPDGNDLFFAAPGYFQSFKERVSTVVTNR